MFVQFVKQVQNQFPLSRYPIQIIDHFSYQFVTNIMLRISLIQVGIAILVSTAFQVHISEIQTMLQKAVQCIKPNAFLLKNQVKLRYISVLLNHFLYEHVYVCTQVQKLNDHLWSHNLFYSIIPHLVSNVYFFYRLIYHNRHLSTMEYSLIMLVIVLQFFLLGSSMLPLAKISKTIHICHKNIPAFQQILNVNLIFVKLEYQTLYERVAARNFTYGFSIGKTDKTLSIRTIFEVILANENILKLYLFLMDV